MNSKFLPLILFCLAILLPGVLFAQTPEVRVKGIVEDSASLQPVEFATVMILDKTTGEGVAGGTTDIEGRFDIPTTIADFVVTINFIGFELLTIEDVAIENGIADLGTITLASNSQLLDEVVVTGEKSYTEFRLDKRVFNVGKDLSSTGASVLEVLNNVPSVNVNIEGQISLRGSTGVEILINGKPSVLADESGNALGTITADMIDRIEVITNPSAKYNAEGTSGIINIVLKKEEREGLNGSVSLNTGWPHNHSFGLSMNRRTEHFNLFSQVGVGYRELPNNTENINQDLVTGTTIQSLGTEFRNENFYNFILGTDYHINDFNVITLSGNFAYEVEDQPSLTFFQGLTNGEVLESYWFREEVTEATNPKWRYELQYKKDFADNEDRSFLFSALGNFFGKDQTSAFSNSYLLGEDRAPDQETRTDFKEAKYTFQADYVHPVTEKITIETGAQYVLQDVSNDFAVLNLLDGVLVEDPGLTNEFDFNQNVLGVYGTGSYEGEKWGVKLGLRAEHTDLSTLLVTTGVPNERNFLNWFPSAHASYKVNERISVQAGYSRRIYRPRLWDLNPFFNIRNNFSVRTGNPNLQPEFTDSYEVTSIYLLGEVSLNVGVYYRYTTEVIERISFFENNVNTFKPVNLGVNHAGGLEFNAKYSPARWWTLNADANYNYFNRQGVLDATAIDFVADQWSAKLNSKFKLPAQIDLEVTGQYRSAIETVQGSRAANLFADLGVRMKVMNGKGVLSLSVRDVFASRFRESETIQEDFYVFSRNQRGRFIAFGFSYGFGKGEAMEYSGQRRHH